MVLLACLLYFMNAVQNGVHFSDGMLWLIGMGGLLGDCVFEGVIAFWLLLRHDRRESYEVDRLREQYDDLKDLRAKDQAKAAAWDALIDRGILSFREGVPGDFAAAIAAESAGDGDALTPALPRRRRAPKGTGV